MHESLKHLYLLLNKGWTVYSVNLKYGDNNKSQMRIELESPAKMVDTVVCLQ